jgi:hypothetical protein
MLTRATEPINNDEAPFDPDPIETGPDVQRGTPWAIRSHEGLPIVASCRETVVSLSNPLAQIAN